MALVRRELRTLSRLAAPAIAAQVGMQMLGVVDMAMVGRLGADALAAVALGDLWAFGTLFLVVGVVMGMDPLVSQGHGARDSRRVGLALQWGVVVGATLSIPLVVLWWFAPVGLELFGQDPSLSADAGEYLRMQLFGAPSFVMFMALRHYLQGRAIVALPMWIIFFGNIVNILANWLFIYGNWGCPELGIRGAGLSTGLTRLAMVILLLIGIIRFRYLEKGWIPWSRESISLRGLLSIVSLGIPISIQIGLELWAFNASALLAGRLGSEALAAHVIVVRFASFSYMFPLGLSFATTTRVGNLIGMGSPKRADRATWVAMGLAAIIMGLFAILFLLGKESLPRFFTKEAAVILLAASAFPAVAAFQLFDGLQAIAGAAMRGTGKTRPAAVINLIGYWVLGLPVSWWLAFRWNWGLSGIWWGLCAGLGAVAIALMFWVWRFGPRTARTLS